MKILRVAMNVSEGKDLELVEKLKEALMLGNNIEVIDVNTDKDHNRTVFVYEGEALNVLEATKSLSKKAIELIDMTKHKGSHPRMGAVDVVPFIPIKNITIPEAVEVSKEFGKYLGSLGVPVYYYEEAATRPDRKSLVDIRRGQYEALPEKMAGDDFKPDEGPHVFVPRSGATVVGVRFPLVAFNVDLKTEDLEIGKKIVKAVRGATGGYANVRAIALEIPDKKCIQISMNLTQYEKTPIHRVFETIKSEAKQYGVLVESTELVAGVPLASLEEVIRFYLQAPTFSIIDAY